MNDIETDTIKKICASKDTCIEKEQILSLINDHKISAILKKNKVLEYLDSSKSTNTLKFQILMDFILNKKQSHKFSLNSAKKSNSMDIQNQS